MTRFLLLKKKTNNKPVGAIPLKKGITKTQIRSLILKSGLNRNFRTKIVSREELKKTILVNRPKIRKRIRKKR